MIGRQDGFTLLELLLVVTVLSAVAWMSLGVVGNNADQVRFEDTRNRLHAIRRAIIGDTSRTVNGQPEVRGYVADMGGLPDNLQALVAQDYCVDLPQHTTSGACTGVGGTWVTQNDYAYDATTGIWAGWNGPYLAMDTLVSGASPRFLDGWGNNDNSGDFGWIYSIYDDSGQEHLLVQSLGRDGIAGGANVYEDEYPEIPTPPALPLASQRLISESEYRIKITESGTTAAGDASGGLRMDFGAPASCWSGGTCSDPTYTTQSSCVGIWSWISGTCSNPAYTTVTDCVSNSATWTRSRPRPQVTNATDCNNGTGGYWQPSQNLCMAMRVVQNGALVQHVSYGATSIQWDGTQKVATYVFEDATGPTYDEDTYLFQGQMAWGVFEYDSTAIPPGCNTNKPFPAGSALWNNFTYVPGNTLLQFERTINP